VRVLVPAAEGGESAREREEDSPPVQGTAVALPLPLSYGKVQMLQLERDVLRVLLGGTRLWEQVAAHHRCRSVQVNEAWVDYVYDTLLGVIDARSICYDDAYSRVWEVLDWINQTLATTGRHKCNIYTHIPTYTS
jgi:hypothetical protein